ncbi:hypothetical protein [Pseudomonas sp. W2-17]
MMASLPLIGGCAERLLIALELNTFVPISVLSAQKAASSPHHPDGEKI